MDEQREDGILDTILCFFEDNPVGQFIMGVIVYVALGMLVMGSIVFCILAAFWTGDYEWMKSMRQWRPS